MSILAAIDQPSPDGVCDPLNLRVEGWLYAAERDPELQSIEIQCEGHVLGCTQLRFYRPDVCQALHLAEGTPAGFSLLLSAPELFGRSQAVLECHARFHDGSSALAASRTITPSRHDHRTSHYGMLVDPQDHRLFHRAEIYTSGASQSEPDAGCLALLRRYLPLPGSVLDVGCGFGSYGRALRAAGYEWMGAEVKASDCAELKRLGLPHVHVAGRALPFGDATFDAAISIEVLEHIAEPTAFLAEIRRVIRRRLLLSVPNAELIPYLHRYAAVPWHLLEGDHKNFFTRASLRDLLQPHFRNVEILSYAQHPLPSPDGGPLYYHLFAICDP